MNTQILSTSINFVQVINAQYRKMVDISDSDEIREIINKHSDFIYDCVQNGHVFIQSPPSGIITNGSVRISQKLTASSFWSTLFNGMNQTKKSTSTRKTALRSIIKRSLLETVYKPQKKSAPIKIEIIRDPVRHVVVMPEPVIVESEQLTTMVETQVKIISHMGEMMELQQQTIIDQDATILMMSEAQKTQEYIIISQAETVIELNERIHRLEQQCEALGTYIASQHT